MSAGKAKTSISNRSAGKGKNAASSDTVHEGDDYASELKATKGSEKLFVHAHVTLQSIAHKMNQRNNLRKGSTGKWKHVKHPLILATTVPQPLPVEDDQHQGYLKSDLQRNHE